MDSTTSTAKPTLLSGGTAQAQDSVIRTTQTKAETPTFPRYPKLSSIVPSFVLGCAAFSNQININPHSLPVNDIICRALQLGFHAFDTSPYYGDSEVLLGQALHHLAAEDIYQRSQCILMTKVGRISAREFDYSSQWVRKSVERSLQRLDTTYLDVVFCHDVEFVSEDEVFEAVSTLYQLVDEGKVRYVGISGYPVGVLLQLATKLKERCGRALDVVQSYSNFSLQNTRLGTYLPEFCALGVDVVFTAGPLSMGLLRKGGVPVGELGDFHPAPRGLRNACKEAAEFVESKGDDLASLAVRFVASHWSLEISRVGGSGSVILGGSSSIYELEENLKSINRIMDLDERSGKRILNERQMAEDDALIVGVKDILAEWVDYTWESPGPGFERRLPVSGQE